jgi:hypothetical protein
MQDHLIMEMDPRCLARFANDGKRANLPVNAHFREHAVPSLVTMLDPNAPHFTLDLDKDINASLEVPVEILVAYGAEYWAGYEEAMRDEDAMRD